MASGSFETVKTPASLTISATPQNIPFTNILSDNCVKTNANNSVFILDPGTWGISWTLLSTFPIVITGLGIPFLGSTVPDIGPIIDPLLAASTPISTRFDLKVGLQVWNSAFFTYSPATIEVLAGLIDVLYSLITNIPPPVGITYGLLQNLLTALQSVLQTTSLPQQTQGQGNIIVSSSDPIIVTLVGSATQNVLISDATINFVQLKGNEQKIECC